MFIIQLYMVTSIALYGIAVILLQREAENNNFKMIPIFYGTYNVILYYRELKKRHEKLSKRFWFYLLASLNFIFCAITFLVGVFFIAYSN